MSGPAFSESGALTDEPVSLEHEAKSSSASNTILPERFRILPSGEGLGWLNEVLPTEKWEVVAIRSGTG